jgi:hypothetical protein
MLANNNVSAGRVVTKMQFDINFPVPRLLFSPASAVPNEMRDAIVRQGKTPAAENAVKLSVFKTDGVDEVEAPAQPASFAEVVPEPIKRASTSKASAEAPEDVSNIVKKWSKK